MKKIFLILIIGMGLIFSGCSARMPATSPSSSISESKPTQQEGISATESDKSESKPTQQECESSKAESSAESSSEVISALPVPTTRTESIPTESTVSKCSDVITIKRLTLQGEQVTISVNDSAQQEIILAFVNSLISSDLETPPATGGIIYEVSITRAGSQAVEQFTFTGQKTDDGYIMAKNDQSPRTWLLADETSYDYLEKMFA